MEREYVYRVRLVYTDGSHYFLKRGKLYSLGGARGQAATHRNYAEKSREYNNRYNNKPPVKRLIKTEVVPYILHEAGRNTNAPLPDNGTYEYIVREPE